MANNVPTVSPKTVYFIKDLSVEILLFRQFPYLISLQRGDKLSDCKTMPRGYRTFIMLNSAEYEICPANKLLTIANSFLRNIIKHGAFSANKYENANYCRHFYIY